MADQDAALGTLYDRLGQVIGARRRLRAAEADVKNAVALVQQASERLADAETRMAEVLRGFPWPVPPYAWGAGAARPDRPDLEALADQLLGADPAVAGTAEVRPPGD